MSENSDTGIKEFRNAMSGKNDEAVRKAYVNILDKAFKTSYMYDIKNIHSNSFDKNGREVCIAGYENGDRMCAAPTKSVFTPITSNEICNLAKEASTFRDAVKYATREKILTWVAVIWARELRYGSKSFEDLRKTKSCEEIFYSSFRTDGSDLHLESNSIYSAKYDLYKAHPDDSTYYPENISDNYSSCYPDHVNNEASKL